MAINLDAIGKESEPHESSWDSKDCLLYSLGVGAGASDPTGFELEFTTENTKGVSQKKLDAAYEEYKENSEEFLLMLDSIRSICLSFSIK